MFGGSGRRPAAAAAGGGGGGGGGGGVAASLGGLGAGAGAIDPLTLSLHYSEVERPLHPMVKDLKCQVRKGGRGSCRGYSQRTPLYLFRLYARAVGVL